MGNIGLTPATTQLPKSRFRRRAPRCSSDPAALPAAEKAIDSEINEGAREAADEPIPAPPIPLHPLAEAIVPMRDDASIRELARHIARMTPSIR